MKAMTQTPVYARILVPLDGSALAQQAIAYASAIAGPDATLVLLTMARRSGLDREPGGVATAAFHRDQEAARRDLAMVAESLRCASPELQVETVVGAGDPGSRILTTARKRNVDLIVMAGGTEAAGRSGLGCVAGHVVRTATVPVMVIRTGDARAPGEGAPIRRLVVPLDGSTRAAQALPVAGALAKRLDVPVHLITVIDPRWSLPPALAYEAVTNGAVAGEDISGLQGEAQRVLAQAEAALSRLAATTSADLLCGPTVDCIAGAVRAGDVVIMASHGRGAATHRQLGSVAEKLVHVSAVPVLVLRAVEAPEIVVRAFDESGHLAPVSYALTKPQGG